MIENLNFNLIDEVNRIKIDRYGTVSAFLAINKKLELTSHDIVSMVRKKLGTKKVGHAGTLDPYASGVLFVLVGKKYTSLADTFTNMNKAYKMKILLGMQTESYDIEGIDIEVDDNFILPVEPELKEILKGFEGTSKQYVPIYSSVKVDGKKLRILARSAKSTDIYKKDNTKFVKFNDVEGKDIEFELPSRDVTLSEIELLDSGEIPSEQLPEKLKAKASKATYPFLEVHFSCSKGTYARQLAGDIAEKLGTKGMLIELQRTRIGSISIENCIDIEDVKLP